MRVALALLLAAASALASNPQSAIRDPQSGWERPIVSAGPGPNLLPIDALAIVGSSPGFADLRLFDAVGREVPYMLVPPERGERRWVTGETRWIPSTKEMSGIEIELPEAIDADAVRLAGIVAPYLKRVTIEGSGDRQRWTVLAPETTIFYLPDQQLRRSTVEFARTPVRFVRIVFDDRSSARAIPTGAIEVREAGVASAPVPEIALDVSKPVRRAETTLIRIRLPERGFPLTAIIPRIEQGAVFRVAKVTELRMAAGGLEPVTLGATTLRRAEIGGEVASDLRIPISRPETAEIELTIEDGSNPPLAIAEVAGEIAPQPAIFFESDGAPLTARWGDADLKAPRYDIEALRPRLAELRPARAAWGAPLAAAPARMERALAEMSIPVGAKVDAESFRFSRVIRGGSGLVAVPVDAAALAHGRPGVDFRIVDDGSRQVPYLLETRSEKVRVELPLPRRSEGARPSVSRYEIELPYEGLPGSTLLLRTSAPYFRREVSLVRPAIEKRGAEAEVARLSWSHADEGSPAPALTIPLPPRALGTYFIDIDEQDNAPLPIIAAELLLPSYRVRYLNPAGKELRLLYGNASAAAPQYDLQLLASRLLSAPAVEATLDPEEEREVRAGASVAFFWIAIVGAAIALLALTAKLVR